MSRAFRKIVKERSDGIENAGNLEEEDLYPGGGARSRRPNPFDIGTREKSSSESEADETSTDDEEVEANACAGKEVEKKKRSNIEKSNNDEGIRNENPDDLENNECTKNLNEENKCTRLVLSTGKRKKSKSKKRRHSNDLEEDLVDSLQKINLLLNVLDSSQSAGSVNDASMADENRKQRPILHVQNRMLDPISEIKNEPKVRGKTNPRFYNSRLATPKMQWPFVGKPQGLTMKLVKTEDGILHFCFEHGTFYQHIQSIYYGLIDFPLSMNIHHYAEEYPFHIDTLIQCSNIAVRNQNIEAAMDFISRALYYMESATHTLFSFSSGLCRLEYKYQLNRSFHIALLKQMSISTMKKAYKTALELCKLALSLDESDPLALILLVDSLALHAQEYRWLFNLFKEWDPIRNLYLMPNMAYSIALARYKMAPDHIADEFLQRALRTFPSLMIPLIEVPNKFKLHSSVREHSYFAENNDIVPPALDQLYQVYLLRCGPMWRFADICEWVENNAKQLIDSANLNSEYVARTKRLFTPMPPFPIRRHFSVALDLITLSDTAEADEYSVRWDPFPPTDGVEVYKAENEPLLYPPPAGERQSATMAFLRSLAPNYQAGI